LITRTILGEEYRSVTCQMIVTLLYLTYISQTVWWSPPGGGVWCSAGAPKVGAAGSGTNTKQTEHAAFRVTFQNFHDWYLTQAHLSQSDHGSTPVVQRVISYYSLLHCIAVGPVKLIFGFFVSQ
jgi:hypothetical protein